MRTSAPAARWTWPDAWPEARGARLALAAASPSDLAAVRTHVSTCCACVGADACDALTLAVDELCANVMAHGYVDARGPLTVDVEAGDPCRVTIVDAAPSFDPTGAAPPDVHVSAEARAIGGLGIFLARRSVDALRYERRGPFNVVVLDKRRAGGPRR
ncbi:MAG: ATP-binding protein [Gemmatirosa sp.]|nr:ATP-binding protein [Gemmatirosa sp.]